MPSNVLLEDRHRFFPKTMSLSHARVKPLEVHHACKEFVYDKDGVEYLDTRNNVPILGHADERVADAVSVQMNLINTNTRYLHPSLTTLAEELSTILPAKLCKFFIVSSGSEANDLALRLSRYYTGKKRTIAQTQAYHGVTISVMEVSESKFRSPHCMKEDWVEIVDVPDILSGPHDSCEQYLDQVKRICDTYSGDIAAMIIESIVSVGGGILHPPGYVQRAFQMVRDAGGVCICDETQVGLGRTGKWWAFEYDGVVPDILTLGKQLGNGFPVAAVVTTEEICEAFENTGIEFFSTFGGSTVPCTAGFTTIKALKDDDLVNRARVTGHYLIDELGRKLGPVIPRNVKEIRGRGLYMALHLASGTLARHVHDTLYRDFKILTTLDGPEGDVMIIKPPLCFSQQSCDRFIEALHILLR
jgi:4-aminobutyrate aminotransferase-like enzyme